MAGRADDRDQPAQPRTRLLAGAGPPGRVRARTTAAAHAAAGPRPPGRAARRGVRNDGRRRPTADRRRSWRRDCSGTANPRPRPSPRRDGPFAVRRPASTRGPRRRRRPSSSRTTRPPRGPSGLAARGHRSLGRQRSTARSATPTSSWSRTTARSAPPPTPGRGSARQPVCNLAPRTGGLPVLRRMRLRCVVV